MVLRFVLMNLVKGVHGLFQNELFVHGQTICKKCGSKIIKTKVNGRGTYYCPKCQDNVNKK